jgi:hypothetical protein
VLRLIVRGAIPPLPLRLHIGAELRTLYVFMTWYLVKYRDFMFN